MVLKDYWTGYVSLFSPANYLTLHGFQGVVGLGDSAYDGLVMTL
jgi:hypothetical protein